MGREFLSKSLFSGKFQKEEKIKKEIISKKFADVLMIVTLGTVFLPLAFPFFGKLFMLS